MHLADGTSGVQIIGWIGIPLGLAIVAAIVAGIKGAIRFAQYMVRTEESQGRTAVSNESIEKKLDDHIAKTDRRLGDVEREVAVLNSWVPHGPGEHNGRR